MQFAVFFTPEQLRLLGALAVFFIGLILSRQFNGIRYLGFVLILGAVAVGGYTCVKHGSAALLTPGGLARTGGVSAEQQAADEARIQPLFRPMQAGEWRSFRGQNGQIIKGRLLGVSKDGVELEREDGQIFRGSPRNYAVEEQAYFQGRRLDYLVENSIVPAYLHKEMSRREILEATLSVKKQIAEAARQHVQSFRISHPNCSYRMPLDYKTDLEKGLVPEIAELEDMLKQPF